MTLEKPKILKRKRRKPKLDHSLMMDQLKLDIKTNTHFLYECEIRSAMSQACFDMASKRRPRDYIA
jgi:hypothetical protein